MLHSVGLIRDVFHSVGLVPDVGPFLDVCFILFQYMMSQQAPFVRRQVRKVGIPPAGHTCTKPDTGRRYQHRACTLTAIGS